MQNLIISYLKTRSTRITNDIHITISLDSKLIIISIPKYLGRVSLDLGIFFAYYLEAIGIRATNNGTRILGYGLVIGKPMILSIAAIRVNIIDTEVTTLNVFNLLAYADC